MTELSRYHVASGSYFVGESGPLVLAACLGTCVGLALYDRQAGIGGISHLLLSEPTSPESAFQPQKYATTGLPIFFEALLAAGACRQNLKATIAGGALVGPLEDYDLTLDIGGRTTERVMDFLTQKEIKIEKSETGGFFTCILSLNMQSWQSAIEPAGFSKPIASGRMQMPAPAGIYRAMKRLQPVPQVALKILRIIDDGDYSIPSLADEIRKDQVLCARTLQLCNSVFFGSRNKIESLDQALVFLGQKHLVKFVISASIDNLFRQTGMGYSLCKGGIYHHAVGTAIVAEKIAALTGRTRPALAFTAGLLHDIGKVVLDQYVQSALPLFYRQMLAEGKNFLELEKNILGTDHTEVGSNLAQRWSFPESLVDTIAYHHRPEDSTRHSELVHIVYLADLLMSRFHAGLEVERLNTRGLASRLERIGLSIARFAEMVDMIPVKGLESSPETALTDD
jgi:putative nucleotidyltransferase with HDIG domain